MEAAEELELVRRMKEGERAAFDKLYEQYYDRLYRTAWQIAKKHAKERPEECILELADTSTADSPTVKVLKDEQERAIAEAVRKLEHRQRTTVVLYYYNGLGTKEIARVMECMEGTVKSRLFNARKNLRTLLENEMEQEVKICKAGI